MENPEKLCAPSLSTVKGRPHNEAPFHAVENYM